MFPATILLGILTGPVLSGQTLTGTATFREGLGVPGYSGTEHCYIDERFPTSPGRGTGSTFSFGIRLDKDIDDNIIFYEDRRRQGLLRFNGIFGGGSNQIPANATITNATLTIWVDADPKEGDAYVHRIFNEPWTGFGSTFNLSFVSVSGGGGASSEAAAADGTIPRNTGGFLNFNVTNTVAAWKAGARNDGWVFAYNARPFPLADRAEEYVVVAGKGSSDPNIRPQLAVTFSYPAPVTVSGLSRDTACPGTEVVITGSGFLNASAVSFAGVAAAGFTVVSSTEIRAVAPASFGSGTVAVAAPGGSSASAAVVKSLVPGSIRIDTPGGTAQAVLEIATINGVNYGIEAAPAPAGPWSEIATITGDGGTRDATDTVPVQDGRFYRFVRK